MNKSFGGVCALRDVCIDVYPGEVHAIVGENGAGKSTLGKILGGAVAPDSGHFELEGKPVSIRNPIDAQRHGIAIIFQEIDLFPNLSVADNIAIQNLAFVERIRVHRRSMVGFCQPFLRRVGFDRDPAMVLGDLDLGYQQLVAIARALSMHARIIVFDESTSALSDEFVERLFQVIDSLRNDGIACLFISHKMEELFRICDRVTVLRDGRYVSSNRISEVSQENLISQMVGRDVACRECAQSHATDVPLLSCHSLKTSHLKGLDFTLHKGEVLGLAGLIGSGRSELGKALFGMVKITSGRVQLGHADYAPRSPRSAIDSGVGLVPRNRKTEGLMMQLRVRDNTTLSCLSDFSRAGFLTKAKEASEVERVSQYTHIRASKPQAEVETLSGGNQQKVLLARWLLVGPEVYFLDDPTRGVDVGAKEDIYGLIEGEAAKGKGIILVSSELPELLRCCDRILVLNQGHQSALVDCDSTTAEEILTYATSLKGVDPLPAKTISETETKVVE